MHHDVDCIAQVLMDLGNTVPIPALMLMHPTICDVGLGAKVGGDAVRGDPAGEVEGGFGRVGVKGTGEHLEEILSTRERLSCQ